MTYLLGELQQKDVKNISYVCRSIGERDIGKAVAMHIAELGLGSNETRPCGSEAFWGIGVRGIQKCLSVDPAR
jgi:hypothetical protein